MFCWENDSRKISFFIYILEQANVQSVQTFRSEQTVKRRRQSRNKLGSVKFFRISVKAVVNVSEFHIFTVSRKELKAPRGLARQRGIHIG